MKIFDLDSPLIAFLNKLADIMWLNILTMLCCIPVVTAGAALTSLHYMSLKIIRNEECYITRGFFKSFKENFKQSTLIWLLFMVVIGVLVSDFYIVYKTDMEMPQVFNIGLMSIAILVGFTFLYVFPVLAKFENTIMGTLRNAFVMSVLQFPKTILMIVLYALPLVVLMISFKVFPFVFLFGISLPAVGAAWLYNGFFKKLEAQMGGDEIPEINEEDDERIFKDELDESIKVD